MGGVPLPGGDPDDGLVRRAARRDTAAFARLVRLHHEALTRVALVVTLDPRTAALAVRESWPSAWERLDETDEDTSFVPWAAAIVVDEAGRIAGRGTDGPADTGLADDPGGVGARLAAWPERDRALVALHVLAGVGLVDLARRERRSTSRVEARIRRRLEEIAGIEPLRTWAHRPVRPVDADRTARWARDEAAQAQIHRWSVLVAGTAALVVAGLPYFARLLQH